MADHGSLLFTAPGGAEVARMAIYVQGSAQAWPGGAAALAVVPSAQALADGEAPLQLMEGMRYEYEIDDRRLELALAHSDAQGVVTRSRLDARKHSGVLNPGLATGQLLLVVRDAAGSPVGSAAVEVRSRKLNYKADYRQMMENITVRCVDLLQELRAPSVFKAIPDPGHDSATLGQRFAFVRALLQSRAHGAMDKGGRLATIGGSPPDLANLPAGCAFADRCPMAQDACRSTQPDAVVLAPGHLARCLRTDATAALASPV